MIAKNYIKMCRKNEDLQKAWKPKIGDIYFNQYNNDSNHIKEIEGIYDEEYYKHNYTHLPTQEQLWEMVKGESYRLRIEKFENDILIECFFKNKVEDSYYVTGRLKLEGNNYQELLLRIVMYRKYNKTWISEKWVKAE